MPEASQPPRIGRLIVVARGVSFGDGVGGLERAVGDHIRALAAAGWDVQLVAPPSATMGVSPVKFHPVPWPAIGRPGTPAFGLAYVMWTRTAGQKLQQIGKSGDTLYVHGASAGVLRYLGDSQIARNIAVANPHGMEEFVKAGALRWLSRAFTRWLARGGARATWVVATDDSMVPSVVKNIRVPEHQVRVIPNGVDIPRLDAQAGDGERTKADIVSVGRLVFNKGYDLLAEALVQLSRDSAEPITWAHYGAGAELSKIRQIAARSTNLKLQVHVASTDHEVQQGLRAARVFVQPSRYEGSSLTTLEAMTHGRLCVGTPVGGIPDKIVDGKTGFLATASEPAAIADAITRAMRADPSIGLAARRLVETRFSLNSVAAQLTGLLTKRGPYEIVQVARHIAPGSGVAQVVDSLTAALRATGLPVSTYTLRDAGLKIKTPISGNLFLKLLLLVEVVWFSLAGTLKIRQLRRERPRATIIVHGDPVGGDIYVNHGLLKAAIMRKSNSRIGIPANPMHWFTLARDAIRYRGNKQGMVVCLNSRDVETLVELYPRLSSPIQSIPNGVSLSRFSPADAATRTQIRVDLQVPDQEPLLLFVGHEFERKGLLLVLEAMSGHGAQGTLVIAGGDPQMVHSLQQHADQLGLSSRIRALGKVSDPAPLFAAADIFVLPSAYEAAQLVLLEALAAGCSCVCTPVGTAPDLIEDGINGKLVERTPESIAIAINSEIDRRMRDPAAAIRKSRSVAMNFSWEAIADQYIDASRAKT